MLDEQKVFQFNDAFLVFMLKDVEDLSKKLKEAVKEIAAVLAERARQDREFGPVTPPPPPETSLQQNDSGKPQIRQGTASSKKAVATRQAKYGDTKETWQQQQDRKQSAS